MFTSNAEQSVVHLLYTQDLYASMCRDTRSLQTCIRTMPSPKVGAIHINACQHTRFKNGSITILITLT